MERTLEGSCACGRNHYVVQVPPASDQLASVLFDSSLRTRRHQGTPFSAFLRVPLSWYRSSAEPLYPDEPLSLIRRTFHEPQPPTPPPTPTATTPTPPLGLRRQFCGFCGTPLTSWHERTREDADFISLTLGSLREQDVRELEDMGLFHHNGDAEAGIMSAPASRAATPPGGQQQRQPRLAREVFGPLQVTPGQGAPWFERLVENSRLGTINRTRGGYAADDGSYREEWEVVEFANDEGEPMDTEPVFTGKRKLSSS
ncbi:mss4-like protein [Diplodia corticola]|uniref:Mss4-like protein n=1 Tax=Diplodia corticola TaxID=236234 RepID=A0A1J9R961_9PEZI|nr:mss4-like protein [Diplodia corticola]OJD28955.1 mss4-like protein [Diplodia corticola]